MEKPAVHFDLFVTNVEKSGPFLKIWGQKDHASATQVERLILQYFEQFEKGEGIVDSKQLQLDTLCCARYQDGAYYRARIIAVDFASGYVSCLFIDYGNQDKVPLSDIRVPANAQSLFRIPAQATSFVLTGLVGQWDESVLRLILDKIGYEEVKCLIVKTIGQNNEFRLLKLYFGGKDFSEFLITGGYATPVDQSSFEVMMWTMPSASPVPMTIPATFPNAQIPLQLQYTNFVNQIPMWQRMMVTGGPNLMMPPMSAPPSLPIIPPSTSPVPKPVDMRKQSTKLEALSRFSVFKLDNNTEHKVYVSYVEKGTFSFAAQLLSHDKELEEMMAALNKPNVTYPRLKPPFVPGIICLGKYSEDDSICRAVITNVDQKKIHAYFVDYGNSDALDVKDLFEIPPEYTHLKVMAIQFTLSGLKEIDATDEMKQMKEVFYDIALEKEAVLRVVPPKCEDLCTKQEAELFIDDINVKELINIEILKKRPKSPELPTILNVKMPEAGAKVRAVVAYIKSAGNFYVQLASQERELKAMMAEVEQYCKGPAKKMKASDIQIGTPCCALFEGDDQWYRALIKSDPTDISVIYIDYGNEEKVTLDNLRVANSQILQLRAQAIPCALSGFEHCVEDDNISSRFEEIALEKTFMMHVVQLDKQFPRCVVRLLDESGTDISQLINPCPKIIENGYTPKDSSHAEVHHSNSERSIRNAASSANERVGSASSVNGWDHPPSKDSRRGNDNRTEQLRSREMDCPKKNPDAWGIGKDTRSSNFGHCDRVSDIGANNSQSRGNSDRSYSRRDVPSSSGRGSKDSARHSISDSKVEEDSWGDSPQSLSICHLNIPVHTKKPVYVVYSDSPSDFFVHIKSSDNTLENLMDQISTKCSDGGSSLPPSQITVGTVCLAKYSEDQTWYRAVIQEVSGKGVKVFFCDYGNKDLVDSNDLRSIDQAMVALEGQAVHCALMGIPPGVCSGDKLEEFSSLSDSESLEAEFIEVKDSIYQVILKDTSNNTIINESFGATAESMLSPTSIVSSVKQHTLSEGSLHDVSLQWFINPGRFYVGLKSSEEEFSSMMKKLQKVYKGKAALASPPSVGQIVVARFKDDNALYRGQVKVQKGNKYGIQFVDYGNRSLVEENSLYPLEHQFSTVPCQAIQCCLQGVRPVDGEWPKGDSRLSESFSGNLQCTILSKSGSDSDGGICYHVSILNNNQDVSQDLIRKGLAVPDMPAEKLPTFPEFPVEAQLFVGQTMKAFVDFVEDLRVYFALETGVLLRVREAVKCIDQSELTMLPSSKATSGEQCLVRSEVSEEYRRAIITDSKATAGVIVQFMDHGGSEELSCDKLYVLPQKLVSIPTTIFECSVTNLPDGDLCKYVNQNIILDFHKFSDGRLFATVTAEASNTILPMPILRRKMGVTVAHASGSTVWLQQVEQEDQLTVLLDEMFEAHEDGSEPLVSTVVGAVCAAKSEADDNWYRAEVEEVSGEKVTVRYLDYGNSETLPISNLKVLKECFLQIPALAAAMELPITTEDPTMGETILELSREKVFTALVLKDTKWFAELLDGKIEFSMNLVRTGRALSLENNPFPALLAECTSLTSSLKIGSSTSAFVSFNISPSEFYIQEVGDKDSLDKLQEDLQTLAHCMKPLDSLKVGSMCMALYEEDSLWYRGMIMAENKILFVDYGNMESVEPANLKVLPPALEQLKHYAVKCCLQAPEGKQWSRNASDRLTELVIDSGLPVDVTVLAQQGDTKVVDLMLGAESVSEILISGKFLEDHNAACKSDKVFVTSIVSPSDFWVSNSDQAAPSQSMHCALYLPSNIEAWSQSALSHFRDLAGNGTVEFELETLIPGDISVVSLALNGDKIDKQLVALCSSGSEEEADSACMKGYIAFSNSPSDFFVHLTRNTRAIEEMVENLEHAHNFAVCENVESGTLCAALFDDDGFWYRAKVLHKEDDSFHVLFIDYGNKSRTSQLKTLPPHLGEIPPLALHCSLSAPDGLDWSDAALNKFELMTADEALFNIELLSEEEPFIVNLTTEGLNVGHELARISGADISERSAPVISHEVEDRSKAPAETSDATPDRSNVVVDDSQVEADSSSALTEPSSSMNQIPDLEEDTLILEADRIREADSSSAVSETSHSSLKVPDQLEYSLLMEADSASDSRGTIIVNSCVSPVTSDVVNDIENEMHAALQNLHLGELARMETNSTIEMEEATGEFEDSVVEVACIAPEVPLITLDESDQDNLSQNLPDVDSTSLISLNEAVCTVTETELTVESSQECVTAVDVDFERHSDERLDPASHIPSEDESVLQANSVCIDETVHGDVNCAGASVEQEMSLDFATVESLQPEQLLVSLTTYPNSALCELDTNGVDHGQSLAKASDFESEFKFGIPGTVVYTFQDCCEQHLTVEVSSTPDVAV